MVVNRNGNTRRFLTAVIFKKRCREHDPLENFIGSIKKLSKPSKGASEYKKDLYDASPA
jgi:hypothetical protein